MSRVVFASKCCSQQELTEVTSFEGHITNFVHLFAVLRGLDGPPQCYQVYSSM